MRKYGSVRLGHKLILELIARKILRCILRYLLMAAYIWFCNVLGIYDNGIIAKVVVWITSIYLSRIIMREAIMMLDYYQSESMGIGFVACAKEVWKLIKEW